MGRVDAPTIPKKSTTPCGWEYWRTSTRALRPLVVSAGPASAVGAVPFLQRQRYCPPLITLSASVRHADFGCRARSTSVGRSHRRAECHAARARRSHRPMRVRGPSASYLSAVPPCAPFRRQRYDGRASSETKRTEQHCADACNDSYRQCLVNDSRGRDDPAGRTRPASAGS